MLSTILRAKHLCLVAQCISKTELITCLPGFKMQKVFFTLFSIHSRRFRHEDLEALNRHELLGNKSKGKQFGKIVSLNFEAVEVQDNLIEEEKANVEKFKQKRKNEIDFTEVCNLSNVNIDKLEESLSSKLLNKSDVEEETEYESNNKKLKYVKEDKNSTTFIKIMNSLATKRYMKKKNKIILEGKRLIHEGIAAGHKPLFIFFSRISDVENLNLSDETKLYKIPYKTLQLGSSVVTSQGVVGVFERLSVEENPADLNTIPLTVICDNVRDSGNMGSILRILAAVGCQKAILTKGCVDIWEPKVIRAAAGAHFHLPVYQNKVWTEIESMVSEDNQIYLAESNYLTQNNFKSYECSKDLETERGSLFKSKSLKFDDIPLSSYDSVDYWKKKVTIVIGGETHGLSEASVEFGRKRKGIRVYIPTSKKVESLNNAVALGILSFEVKRQFDKMSKESQRESESEAKVLSEKAA